MARYGLVNGSFIPKKNLRQLRLVTRYRMKLKATIASEVNRLHKILSDAGIVLSLVFTNIQGVSALAIVDGIINNEPLNILVSKLKGQSKKKEQELKLALAKPISMTHKFLLKTIKDHINYLNEECALLDQQIFAVIEPYKKQWEILQTIPGIDKIAVAIIIAEIGVDMNQWETSEKFCSWAGLAPGNNEEKKAL